jgi:hypothetical protein
MPHARAHQHHHAAPAASAARLQCRCYYDACYYRPTPQGNKPNARAVNRAPRASSMALARTLLRHLAKSLLPSNKSLYYFPSISCPSAFCNYKTPGFPSLARPVRRAPFFFYAALAPPPPPPPLLAPRCLGFSLGSPRRRFSRPASLPAVVFCTRQETKPPPPRLAPAPPAPRKKSPHARAPLRRPPRPAPPPPGR